jgi:hypothetical protein
MDITKRIDDLDLLKFHDLLKNVRWKEILHSVKLHTNRINKNRLLYGINSDSIRYRDIVKILTELNFPFEKFPELETYYYSSFDLGFALEKSKSGELNYRIYFEKNYTPSEMRRTIDEMIRSNNDNYFPIIKGIKWNLESSEDVVVTEYQSIVNYSPEELIKRISNQGAHLPKFIKNKFLAAQDKVDMTRNYRPIEAYEATTGRLSFDIRFEKNTVYTQDLCDSEMDMKYKRNLLETLAEFNSVPIGHIATGKDRNGENFFTIYYLVNS